MTSLLKRLFASSSDNVFDPTSPNAFLLNYLLGAKTVSGERVTAERALTISAYFACMRVISEDIGKLPLITYRRLPNGAKERAYSHPMYPVLHHSPNPYMSSMSFRETITSHALGWGDGYAEIVRDGAGAPRELYLIHPSRVKIEKTSAGDIVYLIRAGYQDFDMIEYPSKDILHLHGLGPEGYCGYPISRIARESLGLSLASRDYGASFFGNGANISGTLTHPQKLSEEAKKNIRQSWQDLYSGAENANKIAVLEEGVKWEKMGVPPEEGQFLETRQFEVEEVCRWFRVAPHKIQHLLRSTNNNIEHQGIEHVTDTLMPWTVRWEQEIARKLFMFDESYFAEHLLDGLMRGDSESRTKYFNQMLNMGAMTPNEIRQIENLNPNLDPAGDKFYMQLNMAPLGYTPPAALPAPVEAETQEEEPEQEEPEQEEVTAEAIDKTPYVDVIMAAVKVVVQKDNRAVPESATKMGAKQYEDWLVRHCGAQVKYFVEKCTPAVNVYRYALTKKKESLESGVLAVAQEVYANNYEKWLSLHGSMDVHTAVSKEGSLTTEQYLTAALVNAVEFCDKVKP